MPQIIWEYLVEQEDKSSTAHQYYCESPHKNTYDHLLLFQSPFYSRNLQFTLISLRNKNFFLRSYPSSISCNGSVHPKKVENRNGTIYIGRFDTTTEVSPFFNCQIPIMSQIQRSSRRVKYSDVFWPFSLFTFQSRFASFPNPAYHWESLSSSRFSWESKFHKK